MARAQLSEAIRYGIFKNLMTKPNGASGRTQKLGSLAAGFLFFFKVDLVE